MASLVGRTIRKARFFLFGRFTYKGNYCCHVAHSNVRRTICSNVSVHLYCLEINPRHAEPRASACFCRSSCTNGTRGFHSSGVHFAGHNKWSKVRHIKGPKDAERSRELNKLQPKIRYAVQTGGADIASNSTLATILHYCHTRGIAKSKIEAMIANAVGSKAPPTISMLLEVRGPAGSHYCFIIDALSDNANRTRLQMRTLLKKKGCSLETGSAKYAFSHKGVIRVPRSSIPPDEALDVAIEIGAEDVKDTENEHEEQVWMFLCDPKDLKQVCIEVKSLDLSPISVGLEYIAENPVVLTNDAEIEHAANIISQLLDHADVVGVYDNITTET